MKNRRWGMKKTFLQRALAAALLALAGGVSLGAVDFGLILNGDGGYVSDSAGEGVDFSGSLVPWFSAAGETGSLYISGKVTFDYAYEEEAWAWPPVIELERTEAVFRPFPALRVSLGRQRYRDDGEIIASGLFDGVSASLGLEGARFFLGAFYTGFLYKKTAEILMTGKDRERYAEPLDYGEPGTYFASRRVFIPLGVEFPDLSPHTSLGFTGIGQFDLNNTGNALHSQYLEGRFGLEAGDRLRFTVTATGALAEGEGREPAAHFAGALGIDWDVPGAPADMLSAEVKWGSGEVSEKVTAYTPVSTLTQGRILSAGLSGVMNGRLSYTARPAEVFSFSGEGTVFFRTGMETFTDRELDAGSGERFLGTEAYGRVQWAPDSALRFSAGGGVFIPGPAFKADAEIRWKVNAGLIVSL
jgi:hypothetical protein